MKLYHKNTVNGDFLNLCQQKQQEVHNSQGSKIKRVCAKERIHDYFLPNQPADVRILLSQSQ